MDNPNAQPANQGNKHVVVSKTRLYLAIAVVVLLFGGMYYYFSQKNAQPAADVEKKKEPVFHRDEPTEQQIYQSDYKQKVKEMLDSGRSVNDISKDTKIRRDEIRKIKKENKLHKDTVR